MTKSLIAALLIAGILTAAHVSAFGKDSIIKFEGSEKSKSLFPAMPHVNDVPWLNWGTSSKAINGELPISPKIDRLEPFKLPGSMATQISASTMSQPESRTD